MFGVYLYHPKTPANIGAALRACSCYGSSIFLATRRPSDRKRQARWFKASTDTHRTVRKLPVLEVPEFTVPVGFVPVAVELTDDAVSLVEFSHPRNALYVFGPEDGDVPSRIRKSCASTVFVPTRYCMNLAATVNVVLYDRFAKGVPDVL